MTYVLENKLLYDILLGIPWIHPMSCVASTFIRLLKFNHKG